MSEEVINNSFYILTREDSVEDRLKAIEDSLEMK